MSVNGLIILIFFCTIQMQYSTIALCEDLAVKEVKVIEDLTTPIERVMSFLDVLDHALSRNTLLCACITRVEVSQRQESLWYICSVFCVHHV